MGNVPLTHHESPPRRRIHERERALHRTQKRWVHGAKGQSRNIKRCEKSTAMLFAHFGNKRREINTTKKKEEREQKEIPSLERGAV